MYIYNIDNLHSEDSIEIIMPIILLNTDMENNTYKYIPYQILYCSFSGHCFGSYHIHMYVVLMYIKYWTKYIYCHKAKQSVIC